ncbi:MAG: succinylglutamate desuccinylase/aspartoacylase family protein [Myxococcota bacterium]
MLERTVAPGTRARLQLRTSESFSGTMVVTPVFVVHGSRKGPRVCVIGGIHGDEVNGVEVVRRMLKLLDPVSMRGTIVGVPIANLTAFRRGSRYLPDRRDLNRYFPGRPTGSSASRIAHGLFTNVVRGCEAVIDIHTGSFHRSNLPQLRSNLADPGTVVLSIAFGARTVVNNAGRLDTLRRAATDAGIPAITMEAGEPARFQEEDVAEGLDGLFRLFRSLGMIETGDEVPPPRPSPVMAFLKTRWVRCDQGGILVSRVKLGEPVVAGQALGTISDPLSEEEETVVSPISGTVLGMAMDQVVMPGFAAYHIGYEERPLVPNLASETAAPETMVPSDPEGLDLEERPE